MNKILKYKSSPIKTSIIFSMFLILYFIYWRLDIAPAMVFVGLPLFLYFPGRLLLDSFPMLRFGNGSFGKISLAVLYSFALNSATGYLTQALFGFNTDFQIWGVLFINIVLFIVYLIFNPKNRLEESNYKITLADYIPLVIFALVNLILIFMQLRELYVIVCCTGTDFNSDT